MEVDILPVLRNEYDREDACYDLMRYLRDGTEPDLEFSEVPLKMPVDYADVDRQWKMLYLSRQVLGMEEITEFAREHNLQTKSNGFRRAQGVSVAAKLLPYTTTDRGEDEEIEKVSSDKSVPAWYRRFIICQVIEAAWPSRRLSGITWIAYPKHKEMAFSYLAYGNQASIGTMYSCAAILAVIPPFAQRQAIIGVKGDTAAASGN